MTRPLAALLVPLVLLVLAAPAAAQVTNFNDSGPGSLRQEILNANASGATENIQIPAGTYNLTSGELLVTDGVTLQGDQNGATILNATGAFRVLCIATGDAVDIQNVAILSGRAAPTAACNDSQGGGIRTSGPLALNQTVIEGNSASPATGGGGGIFAAGPLSVSSSVIRNNSVTSTGVANNGGGGIYSSSTADGDLTIFRSTISGNRATVGGTGSGGGGIYSAGAPSIINSTISGNSHALASGALASGGGGGLLAKAASGPASGIEFTTFFGNHSDVAGGALAGAATDIVSSILDQDTAPTGAGCAPGSANSEGRNVEFPGATCTAGGDRSGQDPQLGPLADNGSDNNTTTHEILARDSPAVEFGGDVNAGECNVSEDQRGLGRPFGGTSFCESGSYEFDGRAAAHVPDCSPSGVIPLALDAPPGGDVLQLHYKVDGGDQIDKDTPDTGGPTTPTDVTFAEGRYTLEYWGQWTNGEERGHGVSNILVDQTNPTISVQNNQRFPTFVITRRATVDVQAADALSGLVQNPTGGAVPVSTARRGATTFDPAAVDLCQNTATAPFNYRVLAPGLGVRTVLERVSGRVRVRGTGGGSSSAHASQKGVPFRPLTEPRELPIRSLIDARAGTARLTTARSRVESNIQDGLFSKGIFQVLQSRKTRSRGLTTLSLKGGNFSKCLNRAGKAQASKVSKATIRRLKANAHGRFRTRGRHSAATVRGTIFTVTDRCDGTLTRVKRGRVIVRDFRLHKNVVVRAGKSYLAKARP